MISRGFLGMIRLLLEELQHRGYSFEEESYHQIVLQDAVGPTLGDVESTLKLLHSRPPHFLLLDLLLQDDTDRSLT